MGRFVPFLLPLLLLSATRLSADVALLLEEPFGRMGIFSPTGHSSVYLSGVCAQSNTKLRRCRPGEAGVVIGRYKSVAGYDWLAVPAMPYFYAVESAADVPAVADAGTAVRLREVYRRAHLRHIVPDAPGGEMPKGRWVQLVGAAYRRRIYGFQVRTTQQQDDELIEWLNSDPNRERFNLLFRNCADFAKAVINRYYPKAARRSLLADGGITTPKQIAKCLVKFASKRPELGLSVFQIEQIPGAGKQSGPTRGVMESLVRSKKYVVPLVLVQPWVASSIAAAYLTFGRFNPNRYEPTSYSAQELESAATRSGME